MGICSCLLSPETGYGKSDGDGEKALHLFQWTRRSREVVPDEFTLDCVIRVYGKLGALNTGMAVHGIAIKSGLVSDQSIEVYARNGEIQKACMLFEVKGERNHVIWNSMVSSFIKNEQYKML
ncbi:unnamed protein product [Linum tenue]|uniref:Uncharacterized protein n=1 Tax=Linum tenue TaxID=586396 RepID=A0AAV0MUP1_9ROSI|nr:unnamed protein product [Linum tenue]